MSRKKYIIEGVNSVEDMPNTRGYYTFSLDNINYSISREFIEGRFKAMESENKPTYFAYMSDNPPFRLNSLFLPVGVHMEYDFKLIEIKEDG